MTDTATANSRWAVMVLWLQSEPLPALPLVTGRVQLLHDDPPSARELSARRSAEPEPPAEKRTARQRATDTRRRNAALVALFTGNGEAHP